MKTTTNDMIQEEKNTYSNLDLGFYSVDGGLTAFYTLLCLTSGDRWGFWLFQ